MAEAQSLEVAMGTDVELPVGPLAHLKNHAQMQVGLGRPWGTVGAVPVA